VDLTSRTAHDARDAGRAPSRELELAVGDGSNRCSSSRRTVGDVVHGPWSTYVYRRAMVCHHYCNEPLRCPECVRRFWKWAENHTRGRKQSAHTVFSAPAPVTFYEAAARWRS
jgi:hypothetical protein